MSSTPGHRVDIAENLATVTLIDRRLGWALMDALAETARTLAGRDDVRAVILRSEGPDFSHGADLNDPALAEALREDGGFRVAARGARLLAAWSALPMPTIAALTGRVIGGGVGLALACDLRVAAPGTTLALPEALRGMHLSWQILPRLVATVGLGHARWMAIGGQAVAVEALPSGAVRIAENTDDAAVAVAKTMAAASPRATRHVKATLNRMVDVGAAGEDAARFAHSVGGPDFVEAISAWHGRRPPQFVADGPGGFEEDPQHGR